jgi:hypothetical protein
MGVLGMDEHRDKARYFRKRAEELRADAVDTMNEKDRELLVERAQDCDQMAAGREAIAMAILRAVELKREASGLKQNKWGASS